MLTYEQMSELVGEIGYKDGYVLQLKRDQRDEHDRGRQGRPYLQVMFRRRDVVTQEMGIGYSGKSYVSEAMTVTEFLNAAMGVFLRLEEHECREAFSWRGRAINGPHVSAEARWEIARRVDVRPPRPQQQAMTGPHPHGLAVETWRDDGKCVVRNCHVTKAAAGAVLG